MGLHFSRASLDCFDGAASELAHVEAQFAQVRDFL